MATTAIAKHGGLDLSDDMLIHAAELEKKVAATDVAVTRLMAEIKRLEIELEEHPTMRKITKIKAKIGLLKRTKVECVNALERLYEAGTRKQRGSVSMADWWGEQIPDSAIKAAPKRKALGRGSK